MISEKGMIRMRTLFRKFLAAALALFLTCPQGAVVGAWAAEAAAAKAAVTLDGLDIGEDQVTVKLSGAVKYNSFLTANPPRLVLELLDTDYQLGAKSVAGKGKFLQRVRSGQFERTPRMITRIVMDLSGPAQYRVSADQNEILVKLSAPVPAAKMAAAEEEEEAPDQAPAAKLAVKPAALPKVSVSPAKAARPAAPAQNTEASSELAAMAASADVTKSAPARAEEPAPAAPAPKTKRLQGDILSRIPRDIVTLDFDNTDVKDILKLFAAKMKINVIQGPDVTGSLTLRLTDVPFNEAFRTILTILNLTTTQVGDNILRVVTPAALAKERAAQTGVTKVIPLNYGKAAEMATAVAAVSAAEGRKMTALVDAKNNALIVTETIEGIAATERLIAQLDVRPKQVLIEVKLIEVSHNRNFAYGIQWNYFEADRGKALGKQGLSTIGSQVVPSDTTPGNQPFNEGTLEAPAKTTGGSGVNLPSLGAALGALTLGRVTNNYFLNATLTASASQGKVKVLSDPKIATLNNQVANINVTSQLPYVTSNVAPTGTIVSAVSFVTVGIQLSVTPSINPDGRITLDLNPTVSQPSATAAAGSGGAPTVESRSAKTIIIVRDGETVVIGGLITDRVETNMAKIPVLGDIPLLGWLFKRKFISRSRGELLIFVTPKILQD